MRYIQASQSPRYEILNTVISVSIISLSVGKIVWKTSPNLQEYRLAVRVAEGEVFGVDIERDVSTYMDNNLHFQ